jgi:hypothetical protein
MSGLVFPTYNFISISGFNVPLVYGFAFSVGPQYPTPVVKQI